MTEVTQTTQTTQTTSPIDTMCGLLTRTLRESSPVAVFLCSQSTTHSGGNGQHNAVRYGPCSLHRQMEEETKQFLPHNTALTYEWRAVAENDGEYTVGFGTNDFAAQAFLDVEPDAELFARLVLRIPGVQDYDGRWFEATGS